MDKDSPIVIERVANGYQIRPMFGQGEAVCVRDVMVFQDMGYASGDGVRPTESTLLGFVAQHFTEPKTPNVKFRRGEALACNAGLGAERPGKD